MYTPTCRRNLAGTAVSLLTSSRFPASLVSNIMALQAQIWPQPSVRIEKVLEVIAEVGQPLDGTMLNSSTIMTDTPDLSQASPLEEAEVSTSLAATCAKQKASWCLTCTVCFTCRCMYYVKLYTPWIENFVLKTSLAIFVVQAKCKLITTSSRNGSSQGPGGGSSMHLLAACLSFELNLLRVTTYFFLTMLTYVILCMYNASQRLSLFLAIIIDPRRNGTGNADRKLHKGRTGHVFR